MATAAPSAVAGSPEEPLIRRLLRATEIDTRMIGMVAALALIWVGFNIYTWVQSGEGVFLTPRNLWNLTVQTSSIAVMATGMVLVIVMRHIDLSVGSIIAFVGNIVGVTQVYFLPHYLGLDSPLIWILAVVLALVLGAAVGAFQGSLIAYFGIPAFIVTLGGQLFWRGAAWWVTTGATIAPLDGRFSLIGGGPRGSIGGMASWALAALACVGIVAGLSAGRRRRARYNFPQRPMWAEVTIAAFGCFVALGATAIVNAYPWPERVAAAYAKAHDIPVPEGGLIIPTGYAIPVLIALAAGGVMTFIAKRTRFGRYVYAIGGNPEAAMLAGIPVRRVLLQLFVLLAVMVTVAAVVAVSRLNAGTNSLGTGMELYVIAAAVIGGVALSGGSGSVLGSLLGALVIQFLDSGMLLVDVAIGWRMVIVGQVLIVAVVFDVLYRRAVGQRPA